MIDARDVHFVHLYDQAYAETEDLIARLVTALRDVRAQHAQAGYSESTAIASIASSLYAKCDRMTLAGLVAVLIQQRADSQ